MKQTQQNISLDDNFDQQAVLNSDRGFISVSSTVASAANKESNEIDQSLKASSQKSIQMAKGVPIEKGPVTPIINTWNYDLTIADHPFACIATILFKTVALFLYLFMGLLLPNVIIFVVVMVTSALDFWTVKNVTGRLLVGMRWWSCDGEEGEEFWRFENCESGSLSNQVDKTYFWTGQVGGTLIWGLFLLSKIVSLSLFWGMLTGINFGFCLANLYGYYKCREEYETKLNNLKLESFKYVTALI